MGPVSKTREQRTWEASVSLRADGDGDGRTIDGHAAVFDKWAQIGSVRWGWKERVKPGAFTKTIAEADVRMLHNHDSTLLLARTKNGTLTLEEDKIGLRSVADPAKVSYADDVVELIRRGDIDGMSFGFRVVKDEWRILADGSEERDILEVALIEVSPVTFPAYPQTSVGVRASDVELLTARTGLEPTDVRSFAESFRNVDEDLYVDVINELRAGKPLSRSTSEQLTRVASVFEKLASTQNSEPDPAKPDPAERGDTTSAGTTRFELAQRRQQLLELQTA